MEVAARLASTPSIITRGASDSVSKAVETIGTGPHPERGAVYGLATVKNVSAILIGGAAAATPAVIGALLGDPYTGAVVGAPLSLLAVETVKKSPAFNALVTQLGAKLDEMTDLELRSWLDEKVRRLAPFRAFVTKHRDSLTRIAEATPELKWMLKYIAFICRDP